MPTLDAFTMRPWEQEDLDCFEGEWLGEVRNTSLMPPERRLWWSNKTPLTTWQHAPKRTVRLKLASSWKFDFLARFGPFSSCFEGHQQLMVSLLVPELLSRQLSPCLPSATYLVLCQWIGMAWNATLFSYWGRSWREGSCCQEWLYHLFIEIYHVHVIFLLQDW